MREEARADRPKQQEQSIVTLISLRLDLISQWLLGDVQLVAWPSHSTATLTHSTYPKVENVIKVPLSNILHTNIESNNFKLFEMFANVSWTDNKQPTLTFFSVLGNV